MRVTFVTCGLEHLGIEALAAWVRQAGHEPALVYEARPFSSGSGPRVPAPVARDGRRGCAPVRATPRTLTCFG